MSDEKTVYFLGAGASNASDFGLPTMDGFFRKDDLVLENFSEFRRFIDSVFRGIPAGKLNLEDVITYLELSIDAFGSFGKCPDTYLYDAREQFNQYVRMRLVHKPIGGKIWCSKYKKIFRDLKKNDTIVTLNYDLVTETTLQAIRHENGQKQNHQLYEKMVQLLSPTIYTSGTLGIHVDKRNLESGWYLKLHGSINWYYCPNHDCLGHRIMTVLSMSVGDLPHVCNSCGSPLEMAIVPPTMNKAFGKYPKLGVIWSLARRELTTSTSVVFMGVSFRPSDYYLSWLIKSSFLGVNTKDKSVIVVDKCESVARRIEEMIGVKPIYYNNIDSYISSKAEDKKEDEDGKDED